MDRYVCTNAKIEALRSKLNKMTVVLGPSNIKILKLSQKLDKLIILAQQKLH